MFRFLELSLHGWDLWSPIRIPLDRDVVVLTGPNGSGKTTILDALRQLLNAPRLSSKRRLQHYLRRPDAPALIRAVVSNEAPPGGRPPFQREHVLAKEATLACALVPSGAGSPEKRFAIVDGRASIDDLKRRLLEPRGEWLRPETYARALESAGVTRSLMHVLAIEQGRTNTLFEQNPRDLFQRVIDMLGDRVVLDRYQSARRRYDDTEREVFHQQSALQANQVDLARAERDLNTLNRWEAVRDRVSELDAKLPAAQLQVAIRHRGEAASKIPELRTKVNKCDSDWERLTRERVQAIEAEEEAQRGAETARSVESALRTVWEHAVSRHASIRATLERLTMLEREVSSIDPADLHALESEDEAARREQLAAEGVLVRAEERTDVAARRLERLHAGFPLYPESVERTLAEFEMRDIRALLLASLAEPATSDCAAATEASLGDARFALLVDAQNQAAALDIARSHGFPGPIDSGPRIELAEVAGPLELAPGAPVWLRDWARATSLRSDGSWSDPRGTWVARPDGRVLGKAGRDAAIAQTKQELAHACEQASASHDALDLARQDALRASASLMRERRRRDLLAETALLSDSRAECARAAQALRQAHEEYEHARDVEPESREQLFHSERSRQRIDDDVERLRRQQEGERRALAAAEEELRQADSEIAGLADRVRPDLRLRAERGGLDGVDTVQTDLARAREEFRSLGEPPAPEIRDEVAHLRSNVEEHERHLQDRRHELIAAQAELSACRTQHLSVVSAALVDYRRRAIEVADAADVLVEIDLPRLTDEDRSLDEATIETRFGFDGKEAVPLGDASFSGGQQVIAGLVLLMAMAETEGRGFFLLDEPFAHLSLDRVDQVGRFLRGTRSQFIVTAPTTLDRAQLDPASLVVVLQKKRSSEPFAPVPIVAGD